MPALIRLSTYAGIGTIFLRLISKSVILIWPLIYCALLFPQKIVRASASASLSFNLIVNLFRFGLEVDRNGGVQTIILASRNEEEVRGSQVG